MAKLHFRYGTMGSAKTALALMHVYNFEEKENRAMLLKPETDTRTKTVWSRIGLEMEAHPVSYCLEMDTAELSTYRIIIVDECQFLTPEEVDGLARIVDFMNIPVFCYGLRTDYTSHLFPGSKRLMEIADEIKEIKTTCWCGKSAKFNARIVDGKVQREPIGDSIIDIENVEGELKYNALCRKHYLSGVHY